MKKLYSFLSVLAVAALGASAALPPLHNSAKFMPKHITATDGIKPIATSLELPKAKALHKVAAPAADICDSYAINFVSYDETGSGMAQYTGKVQVAEFIDGLLQITGFAGDYPLYGEYDPETGVFAIEPDDFVSQTLENGINATIAARIMAFEQREDGMYFVETDKTTYDITYNGNGFDTPSDCFLAIVGYNTATGELLQILDFFYNLTIETYPWTDLGACTFVDGIFGPLFNDANDKIEDAELFEPYTFEGEEALNLQQSGLDPNLIRLQYYYFLYGGSGHLEIDITDPNNVIVPMQQTGVILDESYGKTSIASYSALTLDGINPYVPKDGEKVILANGEINFEIKSIGYVFPNTTAEGMKPSSFYSFKFTKASKLILPENFNAGIGNVNVATSDKVEYFNLQGIRIENPTHGLYIRRAGKKVEKVIL